ncbi:hypothetical protein NDU88_008010 [Pleurodeles waltl]|uniref:Uncharacterized protein n=1 Tax=Pleurodeles waltl TaxID=8319 RepID=A0AAV7RRR7_PLEWA|nr:hypothetical protein NDU88_008010 [Pleurodeles waltl]
MYGHAPRPGDPAINQTMALEKRLLKLRPCRPKLVKCRNNASSGCGPLHRKQHPYILVPLVRVYCSARLKLLYLKLKQWTS